MNDDIRRSWQAANRFDAARLSLPWRVEWVVDDWVVVDAGNREVCRVEGYPDIPAWHAGFKALAECIAALPELMGEYKPVASDAAARVAGARGRLGKKRAGELIDPAPEHR